jgi:hypothetical protein
LFEIVIVLFVAGDDETNPQVTHDKLQVLYWTLSKARNVLPRWFVAATHR